MDSPATSETPPPEPPTPGSRRRLAAAAAEAVVVALLLGATLAALLSNPSGILAFYMFMWSASLSHGLPLVAFLGLAAGGNRLLLARLRRHPPPRRIVLSGVATLALTAALFVLGEIHGLWFTGLHGAGSASGAFDAVSLWPELSGWPPANGPAVGPPTPFQHVLLFGLLAAPFPFTGMLRAWDGLNRTSWGTWTRIGSEVGALLLMQAAALLVIMLTGRFGGSHFWVGEFGDSGYRLITLGFACCFILPLAAEVARRVEVPAVRRVTPPTN